jgi:hypothetical protein
MAGTSSPSPNAAVNNLSLEVVRELIAHDRWKTEEIHRHEKELLLIRLGAETTTHTDEVGKPGLIARAEVRKKAKEYTAELPGITDQALYADLLTVSWCGQRLGRYPTAKDAKTALSEVEKMFDGLVSSYGAEEILEAISLVPDFDSRIVQQAIDSLKVQEDRRMRNSPLFTEFHKHYPHIDLELLERQYAACRDNFVEAGVKLLRRSFSENPPDEFAGHPTWKSSYHQHLPTYLQTWQKNLKSIERRLRIAQKAWEQQQG